MGSTFKCWLIANFEIVLTFVVIATGCIFFYFGFSEKKEPLIKPLFLSALFLYAFNFPTTRGVFQFGKFLVVLGIFILFTLGILNPEDVNIDKSAVPGIMLMWSFFAVAAVIGGWLAIYAYNNIGEVLSRRMLYRNSCVSLFEYTWKYTLDRFCNITSSIITSVTWLAFFILISLAS